MFSQNFQFFYIKFHASKVIVLELILIICNHKIFKENDGQVKDEAPDNLCDCEIWLGKVKSKKIAPKY